MADPRVPRVQVQAGNGPTPSTRRIDLSAVPSRHRNITEPRFTVRYDGYVGVTTVRGAEEIRSAAKARRLASPTPSALELHADEQSPTTVYGIPTLDANPADLGLEWINQTRQVRSNFLQLLGLCRVQIPPRMKMLIEVQHVEHGELGHCVRLSWDGDCWAPIHEGEDSGEETTS